MALVEFRKFVVDFESHSERQLLLHLAYRLHSLDERIETLMGDTSALTAAVAQLSTDVDALIAAGSGAGTADQAAIDAATAAVQAVDATVTAALPAPAPAPAPEPAA